MHCVAILTVQAELCLVHDREQTHVNSHTHAKINNSDTHPERLIFVPNLGPTGEEKLQGKANRRRKSLPAYTQDRLELGCTRLASRLVGRRSPRKKPSTNLSTQPPPSAAEATPNQDKAPWRTLPSLITLRGCAPSRARSWPPSGMLRVRCPANRSNKLGAEALTCCAMPICVRVVDIRRSATAGSKCQCSGPRKCVRDAPQQTLVMDTPHRVSGLDGISCSRQRDADAPGMTERVHGTAIISSDLQYTLYG